MKKLWAQVWKKVQEAGKSNRVRFNSGTVYELQTDGSVRRVYPRRPWRGKSERREHIRQRHAISNAVAAVI